MGLGYVVATPGALAMLASGGADPADLLARSALGDWGDLDASDRRANDRALETGERVFSAYENPSTLFSASQQRQERDDDQRQ